MTVFFLEEVLEALARRIRIGTLQYLHHWKVGIPLLKN